MDGWRMGWEGEKEKSGKEEERESISRREGGNEGIGRGRDL